ncbi:hypothetical protein, partial [Bacillus pumilus]|uniref:hypothetical protein n=1 Tax=Bacillus pumilus TaxID=1408 RepID=UPI001C92FB2D
GFGGSRYCCCLIVRTFEGRRGGKVGRLIMGMGIRGFCKEGGKMERMGMGSRIVGKGSKI